MSAERGTEAGTCTLICAKVQSEWSAVRSQIENYRAKAKEFARLSVIAKSLRHSRQYRKLAEMYWALALGEEPKRAEPSKFTSRGRHDDLSGGVSETSGTEVGKSY